MNYRIKEICKEKGILFKDLAARLGITDISLRYSLKRNPTVGTLERIADALDVPFFELFEKPEDNSSSFRCPKCGAELEIHTK